MCSWVGAVYIPIDISGYDVRSGNAQGFCIVMTILAIKQLLLSIISKSFCKSPSWAKIYPRTICPTRPLPSSPISSPPPSFLSRSFLPSPFPSPPPLPYPKLSFLAIWLMQLSNRNETTAITNLICWNAKKFDNTSMIMKWHNERFITHFC